MLALTPLFRSLRHRIFRFIIKVSVLKPLPNIFHRHSRRMYHIIGIETVVTQFVQHYFVRRKIPARRRRRIAMQHYLFYRL